MDINFMPIFPNQFYHVYNQGNNRRQLFFERADYLHFIELIRRFIFPNAEIFSRCIIPNHFHFLIWTNEQSVKPKKPGSLEVQYITNAFRVLQSSFSAIQNTIYKQMGYWFRQRTKFEIIESDAYSMTAFHYIYQNPIRANLVNDQKVWEFLSFHDYAGLRNGTLCKKDLTLRLIGYDENRFMEEAFTMIPDSVFKEIFKKQFDRCEGLTEGLKPSDEFEYQKENKKDTDRDDKGLDDNDQEITGLTASQF